jgi:hypothetical protein
MSVKRKLTFLITLFLGGGGTGIGGTQGFALARRILYHLSNASSPFCFSYSSNRVSCSACIAGITSAHHHSLNFCQSWPQTVILLISISQVAGILSTNHHTWPITTIFNCSLKGAPPARCGCTHLQS